MYERISIKSEGGRTIRVAKRSIEFVQMVSNGYSRNEIADHYCLTKRTIERYLNILKEEIEAKDQYHLIGILFRLKLLE